MPVLCESRGLPARSAWGSLWLTAWAEKLKMLQFQQQWLTVEATPAVVYNNQWCLETVTSPRHSMTKVSMHMLFGSSLRRYSAPGCVASLISP